MDEDGGDFETVVAEDDSGAVDLVHVGFVAGGVAVFEAVGANVYVGSPGGFDVIDHRFGAFGAVDGQGLGTVEDPGGEDEVGQAEGVIGVEMGEEDALEVGHLEGVDVELGGGGGGAADDAGAGVEEIGFAVVDDGDGGTGAVGGGARGAGAEDNDVGGGGTECGGEGEEGGKFEHEEISL